MTQWAVASVPPGIPGGVPPHALRSEDAPEPSMGGQQRDTRKRSSHVVAGAGRVDVTGVLEVNDEGGPADEDYVLPVQVAVADALGVEPLEKVDQKRA